MSLFYLILLAIYIQINMFKLCHSVQIVTEHKHYYQTEVSLARKRKNRHPETSEILDTALAPTSLQQTDSFQFYQSVYSCPEITAQPARSRGIELASHFTLSEEQVPSGKQLRKEQLVNSTNCHNLQPEVRFQTRQFSKYKTQYFRACSRSPFKNSGKNVSSSHAPHPLISKKKPSVTSFQPKSMCQISQGASFFKASEYISESGNGRQKRQDKDTGMSGNDYYLQRTKKKQPKYNPRHSQQTSLNHRSKITAYHNLPELEIFSDPPTITIHPCPIPSLPTPSKVKKQLEDAKSIISRDESSSRLQDVKMQESILLKREVDMFDFITPVREVKTCEMAKAIDRRTNSLVTLKIFREEDSPYRQLEIVRKIESNRSDAIKILKFQQIFMEDTSGGKKIIFVFEPFQRTLSEYLETIKSNHITVEYFMETWKKEVRKMLQALSSIDLQVVTPLHLEDFLLTPQGPKLHNLSKLSQDSSRDRLPSEGELFASLQSELEYRKL